MHHDGTTVSKDASWKLPLAAMIAACVAFAWAYWPTLVSLANLWNREPDYSHGWMVFPIAAFILWSRRDYFDGARLRPSLWGLVLVIGSIALRYTGALLYIDPLEHLSIALWFVGITWMIGGRALLQWAWPGLLFLVFLFPMPYRLESLFSGPLQRVATLASCWLLQLAGQPAFATGNVIHLGDFRIEVVHACNGLRMIMGFLALCVAYALICRRRSFEKILIVLASIPIAVACNILRITTTGFLYQFINAEAAQRFTHDAAGWAMMPTGLAILWCLLWYMDRLFVECHAPEGSEVLRRSQQTLRTSPSTALLAGSSLRRYADDGDSGRSRRSKSR